MDPLDLNIVNDCSVIVERLAQNSVFVQAYPDVSLKNMSNIDQNNKEILNEMVQDVNKGFMADGEKAATKQIRKDITEPVISENFIMKQEDIEGEEQESPSGYNVMCEDIEIDEKVGIDIFHEDLNDSMYSIGRNKSNNAGSELQKKRESLTLTQNMTSTNNEKETSDMKTDAEQLILCGTCSKKFDSTRIFTAHCKEAHDNKHVTVRCAHCGPKSKLLKNVESLRSHHKYVHRLSQKMCPHCDKVICPKYFNEHIQKVHMRQEIFSCTICKKVFQTATGFKDHQDSHAPENIKYISCSICGKSIRESYFKRHVRNHKDDGIFMCEFCGLLVRNRDNFKSHRSCHLTKNGTHLCDICGKNFKSKHGLKVHAKLHSGDAKVKCDICGASLSTMFNLKTHMLIHVGGRPYSCRFCEKAFRTPTNRKVHERIHTGEKPYQCKICPSAFNGCENLNKHMKNVHCNGKTSNKKYKYDNIPAVQKSEDFAEGPSDVLPFGALAEEIAASIL